MKDKNKLMFINDEHLWCVCGGGEQKNRRELNKTGMGKITSDWDSVWQNMTHFKRENQRPNLYFDNEGYEPKITIRLKVTCI